MRQEYLEHCFAIQDGLQRRRVGDQGQRLVEVLTKLSYHADRLMAPVARLDELAAAARIHVGNLRRVLDDLINAEVLDEQQHGAWLMYEVRPDWQQWRLPLRDREEKLQQAEAALKRMLATAESDPEQMKLRMAIEADEQTETSRAFTPLVLRTTEGDNRPHSLVPRTTEAVVRGTSPPVVPGTSPSCAEEVVPRTSAPYKAIGVLELKGCTAPKALGAEGAALAEPAEEQRSGGDDPDLEVLIERMWRVIPDQRVPNAKGDCFAGVWMNRAARLQRPMRMAVDKFLESPPKKLRTSAWKWLRAEYIANAHRLGLQEKLAPYDQERRGWWQRIAEGAKHSLFA